jgi:hypothetical protein
MASKGTGDYRRLVLPDGTSETVEMVHRFTCHGYFVKRRGIRDPVHVREEDLYPLAAGESAPMEEESVDGEAST